MHFYVALLLVVSLTAAAAEEDPYYIWPEDLCNGECFGWVDDVSINPEILTPNIRNEVMLKLLCNDDLERDYTMEILLKRGQNAVCQWSAPLEIADNFSCESFLMFMSLTRVSHNPLAYELKLNSVYENPLRDEWTLRITIKRNSGFKALDYSFRNDPRKPMKNHLHVADACIEGLCDGRLLDYKVEPVEVQPGVTNNVFLLVAIPKKLSDLAYWSVRVKKNGVLVKSARMYLHSPQPFEYDGTSLTLLGSQPPIEPSDHLFHFTIEFSKKTDLENWEEDLLLMGDEGEVAAYIRLSVVKA